MTHRQLYFALVVLFSAASVRAPAQARSEITLEGSVVDKTSGSPVAEARVRIQRSSDDPIFVRTDAAGQFHFAHLTAGAYLIEADRPGFTESDEYSRAPVVVDAPTKLTLALTRYAVISGTVTDPNGLPRPQSTVEILPVRVSPKGATVIPPVYTNDLGQYRVPRLQPGMYYVVVGRASPFGDWESSYRTTYFPTALDQASATAIELAPGQQAQADIRIVRRAGVRIAGRLVKPAGASIGPAPGVWVMLAPEPWRAGNEYGPNATISGDNFEFTDVPPGAYILNANVDGTDALGEKDGTHYSASRRLEVGNGAITGLSIELALAPAAGARP